MISSYDVMDSIRDAIEDYGQACWKDGYDEAEDDFSAKSNAIEEAVLVSQGYVKREHFYQGKTVWTWIEGPDMVSNR